MVATCLSGGFAFAAALAALRHFVSARSEFALQSFATVGLDEAWQAEMDPDELLLDDALPPVSLDSRVVRLFDRDITPATGEPRDRTAGRPGARQRAAPAADDTEAMLKALLELRRSFR